MNNLYPSVIGTCVAEILTLPICTIKTNYQNHQPASITTVTRNLYRSGGIKVFYKASVPAIGAQVFSTSSKYVLYNYFNDLQKKYIGRHNTILSGLSAGIISSLFTHPIDVIRVNMQMNFSLTKLSLSIPTFYRGYSKSLAKVAIGASLFFPLYDKCNEIINRLSSNASSDSAPKPHPFLAAGCSATIATIIMQPIDYLKNIHIYGKIPLYTNFSYYRGLSLSLLRVVPHFMIMMSITEYLKKRQIEN